jgi:translation initiation factor IF-3
MRFANSQKGNKAGKVRQQKLKEIRLRPRTGDHDLETKALQARKFLEHNDKVQVTMAFRGREMQHVDEGRRVLNVMLEKLADVGKVERPPALDGKRMTVMLMPIKLATKGRVKKEQTMKSSENRIAGPGGADGAAVTTSGSAKKDGAGSGPAKSNGGA